MSGAAPQRTINPAEVEQAIREAANTVAEGVNVVTERLSAYREAERIYDLAWAHAYMGAGGPIKDREQLAEIATRELREQKDVAEVAYKYADRRCRAAESTLSAFQTISKSVTAMYGAAGRGEY